MAITEDDVRARFEAIREHLDERQLRLFIGAEVKAVGQRGGIALVERATGMSRTTVSRGVRELAGETPVDLVKVRRKGAGRPSARTAQPGIEVALESLVDPVTRGDPESPLRWTCKSTRALSAELERMNFSLSPGRVGEMLASLGYSLQGVSKTLEGDSHPDRNAQFEFINEKVKDAAARGQPVVSIDTKKKELVGDFKNAGREWQPAGAPVLSMVHDFPDTALGKAIPYGVYDLGANEAWVSVGMDHDTPTFAVNTLATWWRKMGAVQYPKATEIFVTADAGGSNSARSRVWKAELQKLADATGLTIAVSHFPPGTSKWNKIEHRLFSHITMNWRGRPLEDYETVVRLIGATTTSTGLKVRAQLDKRKYPTGVKVPKATMDGLELHRSDFHGEWNYALRPRAIT